MKISPLRIGSGASLAQRSPAGSVADSIFG